MRSNEPMMLIIFLVFSYTNFFHAMNMMEEDNPFCISYQDNEHDNFFMEEDFPPYSLSTIPFQADCSTQNKLTENKQTKTPSRRVSSEKSRKETLDEFYKEVKLSSSSEKTEYIFTRDYCGDAYFPNKNSPQPVSYEKSSPATYEQPQNIPPIHSHPQNYTSVNSQPIHTYHYSLSDIHNSPYYTLHQEANTFGSLSNTPPSPHFLPHGNLPSTPNQYSLSPHKHHHNYLEIITEEENIEQFSMQKQERFTPPISHRKASQSQFTSPSLNYSPRTADHRSTSPSLRSFQLEKIPFVQYIFGSPRANTPREKYYPFFLHYPVLRKNISLVNPNLWHDYEKAYKNVLKQNIMIAQESNISDEIIRLHSQIAEEFLLSKKVTHLLDEGHSLVPDHLREILSQKTRCHSAPAAQPQYMTSAQGNRSLFIPQHSQSTGNTPRLSRRENLYNR